MGLRRKRQRVRKDDENKFIYDDVGFLLLSYVRSLYWSVITICSIGYGVNRRDRDRIPWPETNFEHVFHVFCFLFGVFVLSTVIGQIRGAIENVNAKKTAYKRRMAMLDKYMQRNEVDNKVGDKIATGNGRNFHGYFSSCKIGLDAGFHILGITNKPVRI